MQNHFFGTIRGVVLPGGPGEIGKANFEKTENATETLESPVVGVPVDVAAERQHGLYL